MHYGNDLDEVISNTINHTIRKAMNEVAPDVAIFIEKRPSQWRLPNLLNSSINLNDEFRPEIACTFFVPCTGVLQFSIDIVMDVNDVHWRSGKVCP